MLFRVNAFNGATSLSLFKQQIIQFFYNLFDSQSLMWTNE